MSTKKIVHQHKLKEVASLKFSKLLMPLLILLTVCLYYKSLNNQLTSWDDNGYVTENKDIKTLHGDSIKYSLNKTFSSYVMGNYHPLTMLSFSLEYKEFKLTPKPYHITNLIFHLLNILLVFYFILLLTKQKWVAFITSLLFAIHPMHVESVAWVAERKDVLFSFFFLIALCFYVLYTRNEKKKWTYYYLALLAFLLALFSKALAVSLPIAFIAIDYFIERKINFKTIIEKIPFLMLSFIFGFVAIEAQKSANALADMAHHNLIDRILFSSYGLLLYLSKLIAPINLSCFYDYPIKQNGMYPFLIYLSPIIIIGLLLLVYKSIRLGKDVVFGIGFFLITLALVLQILPVGDAIIADRYSYLPYIGVFFIIARFINNLLANKSERMKMIKMPVIAIFSLFVISCCYITFQQSKIWRDDMTLFNDAIENANGNAKTYLGRGNAFYRTGNYDKAFSDFTNAIKFKPDYAEAYCNRGLCNYFQGKYEDAIKDFNLAIQYNSKLVSAYYNRGLCNYFLKRIDEAKNDFTSAIDIQPDYAEAYCNRGLMNFNLGKNDEAMKDYNVSIQYGPTFSNGFYNRGLLYDAQGKYNEAITDFSSAIQFNPANSAIYYSRASAYFSIKMYKSALEDALTSKQMGYAVDSNFINQIQTNVDH